MRHGFVAGCAVVLVLAAAGPACRLEVGDEARPPAATALLAIDNARIPFDGVLSGGQPTADQIAAAGRAGYRTVISLRTDEEPDFAWEPAAVEAAGMRYVSIPVAGASGLTRDNVDRLDAALAEARAAGPVLLHCGSGNRIGAMLALRAAWIEGLPADEALAVGLDDGLTRLEPATREILGLEPPAP